MPTWDLEPEPGQAAEPDRPLVCASTSATNRVVPGGEGFDLEHDSSGIHIRCRACDRHERLPDDHDETVDAARSAHRCGSKTSAWDHDDPGSPA